MTVPGHSRPRRSARRGPGAAGGRRLGPRSARAAGGVLLAGVCALALTEALAQPGSRQPVLALARPVMAGQVITSADLRVVQVSAAGPVSVVPASRLAGVTGRPAAVSLPAGSLLAAADIGVPAPASGQARLGVVVKPGQYPPDLSPGQRVAVLAVPAPQAGGQPPAWPAGVGVVLSVSAAGPGETVAELQLPEGAVPRVAAADAAGQISLAAIPGR